MVLSDIADIAVGYPFRGRIPGQSGSGIYAVQMKDVMSGNVIDWGTCIETELTGKRAPVWLKAGDILVAGRGNSNYAVMVDDVADKLYAVASPHFYVLGGYSDKVLPEYLQWFINRTPSQRYFLREAEGTLTKSIRRIVLENLPIAVPSIEKQQSIVQLSATIWYEQFLLRKLTHNAEVLMNTIAKNLLQESTQGGTRK